MSAALTLERPGREKMEFQIAQNVDGSAQFGIETRAWEPGDPKVRFRTPIFPLDTGLFENKLANRRGYQSSNADASWKNTLLFPPKLTNITFNTGTGPTKMVQFNGAEYFICGRYVWKVSSALSATQIKDFGVGKAATDMAVFNDEIVYGMGETEKIWTMSNADVFTQASDNTFAVSLGVSGKYLWRSESINRISNCLTAPRTLTSWAPTTDANKYKVGSTTYTTTGIIDYGGTPYVAKPDSLLSADGLTIFSNQAPQMSQYAHAENGRGMFTAQGYLFCPTVQGLLRIRLGESAIKGPELTGRPGFRWWVRGGVEWGESIYLLCTDESDVSETCVIKMMRDTMGGSQREYIYHEIARLGNATNGYAIGIFTTPTNPVLFVGHGNDVKYITLGRGAGRMIDDANYAYGTSMTLDTGEMAPADDLTVVSTLTGVSVLCNLPTTGDNVTVSAAFDSDSYQELLDTQEGGGVADITKTDGWEAPMRYAAPGTEGQQLKIRITGGTAANATGTTRPEIREAWAFGYMRPKVTDELTIGLVLDSQARGHKGRPTGQSNQQNLDWLRRMSTSKTPLILTVDGYDTEQTTRFFITNVRFTTPQRIIGPGRSGEMKRLAEVTLTRIDFAGKYAQ